MSQHYHLKYPYIPVLLLPALLLPLSNVSADYQLSNKIDSDNLIINYTETDSPITQILLDDTVLDNIEITDNSVTFQLTESPTQTIQIIAKNAAGDSVFGTNYPFADININNTNQKSLFMLWNKGIINPRDGLFLGNNAITGSEFIFWLSNVYPEMNWNNETMDRGSATQVMGDETMDGRPAAQVMGDETMDGRPATQVMGDKTMDATQVMGDETMDRGSAAQLMSDKTINRGQAAQLIVGFLSKVGYLSQLDSWQNSLDLCATDAGLTEGASYCKAITQVTLAGLMTAGSDGFGADTDFSRKQAVNIICHLYAADNNSPAANCEIQE